MVETPDTRRQKILHWLQESRSLSIDELVNRLSVSNMTIHRDLDQLASEGLVQKSYGYVMIKDTKTDSPTRPYLCTVCHTAMPSRSAFTLQVSQGEVLTACCPHCGLLLMGRHKHISSALTRDFLYSLMVNVMEAVYVVGSQVHLCCVPSVLCFANQDDAERFARGFGGTVMAFDETMKHLDQHHCYSAKSS